MDVLVKWVECGLLVCEGDEDVARGKKVGRRPAVDVEVKRLGRGG